MSQPFGNQPYNPATGGAPVGGAPVGGAPVGGAPAGGPPGGQMPPGYAPPQQKSKLWMYLLGGCGCATVLLFLCCGGMAYFGATQGGHLVGKMLEQPLREELADSDAVKEHLGEIESLSANFTESAQEQKARGGGNWLVMDAEGSKGDGKIIVLTNQGGGEGGPFSKIDLRLPDGKTIPIK